MVEDQHLLIGFNPTDMEAVRGGSLAYRVERAVALLKAHQPPEGYYLGFSGGKDSVVIKKLAQMAGVKFDAHYNQTTIDPPELVQFIRKHHSDVDWNRPAMNMMTRVATAPKRPPIRSGRWCCEEYKEGGGEGRVVVLGTRAEESPRRAKNWREVSADIRKNKAICPVVYWLSTHIWEMIREFNVPYCSLYDEGFTRLGCVDCPLASEKNRAKERARWPIMANNWKKAIIANWDKWHDVPNTKTGEPRFHARFKNGEEFYQWWLNEKSSDVNRDDCQSGMLWTNPDAD